MVTLYRKCPAVKIVLLVWLAFSSLTAYAEARDFRASGGLGVGPVDADLSGANVVFYERPVIISSFKLGTIGKSQHALYFQYRLSYFRVGRSDWSAEGQGLGTFLGAGYAYYLRPEIGSPYVEFAVGAHRVELSNPSSSDDYDGLGFLIGAGRELNRHLQMGMVLEVSDTIDRTYRQSLQLFSAALQTEFKF